MDNWADLLNKLYPGQLSSWPLPYSFLAGRKIALQLLKSIMGDHYSIRNLKLAYKRGLISSYGNAYLITFSEETLYA